MLKCIDFKAIVVTSEVSRSVHNCQIMKIFRTLNYLGMTSISRNSLKVLLLQDVFWQFKEYVLGMQGEMSDTCDT